MSYVEILSYDIIDSRLSPLERLVCRLTSNKRYRKFVSGSLNEVETHLVSPLSLCAGWLAIGLFCGCSEIFQVCKIIDP